jgi:RHS repeat-associated protein
VRYGYDAAGQLTTVTDWANRVTSYTYDEDGLITRIEFPNSAVRLMEYDEAGQVTRRRDLSPGGTVIVDDRYSYDPGGQMRVESSGMRRPPYRPQPVMMTYGATDERLATYNAQPVTYDNDGNLTSGPLGEGFGAFQYDVTGNLIQAGTESYEYDAEDRLVAFSSGGGTTRLTLNPLPDNPQPIVSSGPGGTTRYVWGVGLIYEETPNGIRIHHYDYRGSTVALSGPSGSVTGTVSYGPFGEIGDRTGSVDSLFLYNGLFGVMTAPNGLNYMRFRWYSPQIKRFLSPDAVFGDTGQPGTLNLYSYAGNNPVTRADASGQFWNVIGGAIAGIVVGVIAQAASDIITGKKPQWEDYAAAAIGGAVGGAIAGACLGVCGPAAFIAAGAVAGAIDGAGSTALASAFRGQEPDPNEVITNGLIGFALGGVAGGAGSKLGSKAGKVARVLDDVPPPPRSILKTGASAVRRKPGRVRFNPSANKTQVIPRADAGNKAFPTRQVSVQKYRFSTREASHLNSIDYGRAKSFSLLAKSQPKAANRLAASVSKRGWPAVRSRTNVRQAGRARVNANRGVGGEQLHQRRWAIDLRRAGKPAPNSPSRSAATF